MAGRACQAVCVPGVLVSFSGTHTRCSGWSASLRYHGLGVWAGAPYSTGACHQSAYTRSSLPPSPPTHCQATCTAWGTLTNAGVGQRLTCSDLKSPRLWVGFLVIYLVTLSPLIRSGREAAFLECLLCVRHCASYFYTYQLMSSTQQPHK